MNAILILSLLIVLSVAGYIIWNNIVSSARLTPPLAKYRVVKPDLIHPDDPHQEPIENHEARDLVNVLDENDRIMANPDDFPDVGEIVNESQFYLAECNYTDEQGYGSAPFAFRI